MNSKGIDLFLHGLKKLNEVLKEEGSDVTVVAFIITNAHTKSYNVESLKGQTLLHELHKTVDEIGKIKNYNEAMTKTMDIF
jgi:hypothetical protein